MENTKPVTYTPSALCQVLFELVKEKYFTTPEVFDNKLFVDYMLVRNREHYSKTVMTSNEFSLIAYPEFGGSEGIYVQILLEGRIEKDQKRHGRYFIGTIKTLQRSTEAMRACGELCGLIIAEGENFINQNISAFKPSE